MAENRHWAAWRQMLEKLDGMGTRLSVFGLEMQKHTAETAQYFHASYDVSKAMQGTETRSTAARLDHRMS